MIKWFKPTTVTKKPMTQPIRPLARMPINDALQGSSPIRNSEPDSTIEKQTNRADRQVDTADDQKNGHADGRRCLRPRRTSAWPGSCRASGSAARQSSWRCRAPGMIAINPASRIVPNRFPAGRACLMCRCQCSVRHDLVSCPCLFFTRHALMPLKCCDRRYRMQAA